MRVLIAPDCFGGTLTATQAAEAIADGWRRRAPGDHLDLLPLSDGGPGFIDVVHAACGGELVAATVSDPLLRPVPASILVVERSGVRTAYVESASACGLHLLTASERDPMRTTTFGVGELLLVALESGVERIVVGLGGSGTNDAGAGMLAALGAGAPGDLAQGGGPLGALPDTALPALASAQKLFDDVELLIATDVDNPLLGLQGASATFAPQKGADPQAAQDLEGSLGRFSEIVARTSSGHRDLLTGRPRRLDKEPGAGAAGGLGFALLVLGGRRVSGVDMVLDAVGFDDLAASADLVVTGEGRFDWQSLHGKVTHGVARRAAAQATPVVLIAGQVLVGRREIMGAGINGAYAVAEGPAEVAAAMADPVGTLTARAERVARTWSPQR